MKTAMQLMLEDLELRYKVLSDAQMLQACVAIEGTIEYSKSLIIKEKEQIEHAHAHRRCLHNKTMDCTIEAYKNAEEYYNQNYNK